MFRRPSWFTTHATCPPIGAASIIVGNGAERSFSIVTCCAAAPGGKKWKATARGVSTSPAADRRRLRIAIPPWILSGTWDLAGGNLGGRADACTGSARTRLPTPRNGRERRARGDVAPPACPAPRSERTPRADAIAGNGEGPGFHRGALVRRKCEEPAVTRRDRGPAPRRPRGSRRASGRLS